jgi:hypothetical protein
MPPMFVWRAEAGHRRSTHGSRARPIRHRAERVGARRPWNRWLGGSTGNRIKVVLHLENTDSKAHFVDAYNFCKTTDVTDATPGYMDETYDQSKVLPPKTFTDGYLILDETTCSAPAVSFQGADDQHSSDGYEQVIVSH